jgi:hypothetical protein
VRPSIEGRVVRSSGATIEGAVVELLGIEDGRVRSRTQTSKADGVFRFSDLVAGTSYQIIVTGPGLQPTAHGQSGPTDPWNPITLSAGQQLTGVEITPQMLTAIRGRVLNAEGRPLVGSTVSVMRTAYVNGRKALQEVDNTSVNQRGEYRFSALPTGVYYLRTKPRHASVTTELYLSNPAELDDAADSGQSVPPDDPTGYPVSYYPGGRLERAAPLRLNDGTILDGIDFRLEEIRTGRLQGTIAGTDGKLSPGTVLLIPEGGALDSNWTRYFRSKDGMFDIRGVLPGSYILLASGNEGSRDLSGRTTVAIANDESKTVTVTLTGRASVRGRVVIDNWPGPEKPEMRRLVILLSPADLPAVDSTLLGPLREAPSGRTLADPEGNFNLTGLQPWTYRVVVASVQETRGGMAIGPLRGAYVKSVRLNDQDVIASGFAVDSTPLENLEITLAITSAAIDGRVTTPDGEDSPFARVVLVPSDRARLDLYQAVTASNTGRFEFQFLAPGSYKVFAWQGLPEGAWYDLEFLKVFEDQGAALEVAPDSPNHLDLRLITR